MVDKTVGGIVVDKRSTDGEGAAACNGHGVVGSEFKRCKVFRTHSQAGAVGGSRFSIGVDGFHGIVVNAVAERP